MSFICCPSLLTGTAPHRRGWPQKLTRSLGRIVMNEAPASEPISLDSDFHDMSSFVAFFPTKVYLICISSIRNILSFLQEKDYSCVLWNPRPFQSALYFPLKKFFYWNIVDFNTLATWCKVLTHWERTWYWEGLKAGGEGDDQVWNSWMASPTRWTWVWVSSKICWWTGKPGVLHSISSQRVGHNWVIELNLTKEVQTSSCKINHGYY